MNKKLDIKDEGVVLRGELPFEQTAVLNPACILVDGILHMFYRAIDAQMISTIGYAQFKDDKLIYRSPKPILFPELDYEIRGLEDPRIVFFEDQYYLFYTAYDGITAAIAYAVSDDLKTFKKRGILSSQMTYEEAGKLFAAQQLQERYSYYSQYLVNVCGPSVRMWDKDGFIFPERINGKIAFVHRIMPGIQIAYVDTLEELTDSFWQDYIRNLSPHILLDPSMTFENRKIGGGCPPIRTTLGWLFIYHGVEYIENNRVYHAAAALLDINNPQKVIGRLPVPLFSPHDPWEMAGVVDNVVFPTGLELMEDRLKIFYGAADSVIAAKSLSLDSLLKELQA